MRTPLVMLPVLTAALAAAAQCPAPSTAPGGGGGVAVYVRTLAPGHGCFTAAAVSSPVDLVRVARRDVAVRFREREVREDCR